MIAFQLMNANRGGMSLFRGIEGIERASQLTRERVCRIALGRALRAKIDGKHNTAGSWLAIAASAGKGLE